MRFVGNGQNIIYIDWQNDLVVVVRWIGDDAMLNEFLGKVIGAIARASVERAVIMEPVCEPA